MTVPPPPPPRTNYLLYGIVGAVVGLAIVVVVLLLSSDGDDAASTTTGATSETTTAETTATTASPTTTLAGSTSTSEATTTTTAAPAFAGDTNNKVAEGDLFTPFAFLDDIRFAQREEGFTRVVFDFEGAEVPWWAVSYAAGPFTNIGDEPVPVAGAAFLQIDLSSTSFDLSGEEVRETYDGPRRIPVESISVTEVVRLEDFEGVSTWIIGVRSEKPFLVGTLTDPPRVYVDIQD